ncbi:aspartate kinase [Caenibacillus caldisaponilyticus]|uniref:aspartate kinase n=1 Tax=Caenibacillus caldisaponilyticus TaxID=1674942 RepID=UPI0009888455|nr:aspartate kinase [Caenibacillus caldisaponilyticus]
MGIRVMKFGGTSVGSLERMKRVARRIADRFDAGDQVVVVVSAMGKTTDELVRLAEQTAKRPNKRELDLLLSTGEQQAIALLTMTLNDLGYAAVSLTGWQAGIRTDSVFGNARIQSIHTERLHEHLRRGEIVVVAGFQGISDRDDITTLGRGGSDTTAVALAAALNAELCEIYTDVDGVFTTDPRVVPAARKIDEISYDEMLEMAYLGAGVLHPRAVENAKKYGVPLVVRSSFNDSPGTVIKEETVLEKNNSVTGLAFERDVARISVIGLPNRLSKLTEVFEVLAQARINVDIIVQNVLSEAETTVSFTLAGKDLDEAAAVLRSQQKKLDFRLLDIETGLAKVSIIGSGMASNPGVAAAMFKALTDRSILIKMVSTSEIKVSTVIPLDRMEEALTALHATFRLEDPAYTALKR